MSGAQKTPFAKGLMNAIQSQADSRVAVQGRSLPCHVVAVQGQIVTVQFDMLPDGTIYPEVTIPVATFPYIRCPIQIGDKGVTVAADVSLRGVSGLGTGMATRSLTFSLTPIFFVPLSNNGWSEEDPNKIVLYGPDGAILKTEDGASSVAVGPGKVTTKADAIYLEAPDIYIKGTVHVTGAIVQDEGEVSLIGPLNVQNEATIKGVSVSTHSHNVSGVQGGDSTVTSNKPN